MSELKPCPFCGGEPFLYRENMSNHSRLAGCASCGIDDLTEDDWNTRAPQSEWISVDTKPFPPHSFCKVIAYCKKSNRQSMADYSDNLGFHRHDLWSVTHWRMPLPNPPEVK